MNAFPTDGLGLECVGVDRLTRQLESAFQQPASTSELLDPASACFNQPNVLGPFRSAMAAVVTAFGMSIVKSYDSQHIHPVWESFAWQTCEDREEEKTSFFEPVRFNWDKKRHRIRVAARNYSKRTHADY